MGWEGIVKCIQHYVMSIDEILTMYFTSLWSSLTGNDFLKRRGIGDCRLLRGTKAATLRICYWKLQMRNTTNTDYTDSLYDNFCSTKSLYTILPFPRSN